MDSRADGGGRARTWAVLVVGLACLPILGVFTTSRIFFVRDLSFFFWSRHLWLRHTIFGGEAPWWDPYVAGGQSAIADALNQLLMPVTVAVRLLPSEVVAFNLWIALPLPLAALGMFFFLRRRTLHNPGAALGACAFALSGPVVSMLNTPNLSWSVALMPWVLLATDRVLDSPTPVRAAAGLAIAFALQALCGEPVTWASTGFVALAYAIFRLTSLRQGYGGPPKRFARRRKAEATGEELRPVASAFRRPSTELRPGKVTVIAALAAGALLAAAQLVPTAMAGVGAHRGALATPDFWSLHPFALWETVAPHLFGNYYDAFLADLPWMGALNFGRDPFFYSLYVGPLVLLLAGIGIVTRFRRNAFWLAIALAFLVAALGGYTPLYPLARRLFPPLMYFRFPVKYLVISLFACAVLVAEGFSSLLPPKDDLPPSAFAPGASAGRRSPGGGWLGGRLAAVAGVGLLLSLALLATPDLVSRGARAFAVSAHLKDPAAGAAFLARVAPSLLARAFGLLLAGCLLVAVAARTRLAVPALFIAVCADLLIANAGLNLTADLAKLSPPAWYTASAGPQRVYIGGRVRGYMNTNDPDATPTWQIPAEATAVQGRMELNAQLPMAPSGWRVREALSYDLPYLWPAEYEATVRRFEQATPAERAAFLRRSGVRRCVLPVTQSRQFRSVADVSDWNMRVFECDPGAMRVFIASSVDVSREPSDLTWQRNALFDPALADDAARLPAMPATSGRPGPPGPPLARIVLDGATTVVVEATTQRAGILVLRDSYDPAWTAEVDGVPAETARANGLYRAVALPPGAHVIRFSYRPRDLAAGLIISAMTALFLMFSLAASRRRARATGSAAGFTLIELMVVLAIIAVLLAIAFNQYRGMQARGNDASALASMRSIAAAQWQFALTCGNMKYASTLPALAQPVPSTGDGFLSPDLTSSAEPFEKSGYIFQMAAKPLESGVPACNGTVPAEGYAATADPVRPGITGMNFYGINADRVIYVDEQQTFTGNLAESGAPKHGGEVK
jgi:prepilin-type N-terminal cleavage/methylation domain-containing protein